MNIWSVCGQTEDMATGTQTRDELDTITALSED